MIMKMLLLELSRTEEQDDIVGLELDVPDRLLQTLAVSVHGENGGPEFGTEFEFFYRNRVGDVARVWGDDGFVEHGFGAQSCKIDVSLFAFLQFQPEFPQQHEFLGGPRKIERIPLPEDFGGRRSGDDFGGTPVLEIAEDLAEEQIAQPTQFLEGLADKWVSFGDHGCDDVFAGGFDGYAGSDAGGEHFGCSEDRDVEHAGEEGGETDDSERKEAESVLVDFGRAGLVGEGVDDEVGGGSDFGNGSAENGKVRKRDHHFRRRNLGALGEIREHGDEHGDDRRVVEKGGEEADGNTELVKEQTEGFSVRAAFFLAGLEDLDDDVQAAGFYECEARVRYWVRWYGKLRGRPTFNGTGTFARQVIQESRFNVRQFQRMIPLYLYSQGNHKQDHHRRQPRVGEPGKHVRSADNTEWQ